MSLARQTCTNAKSVGTGSNAPAVQSPSRPMKKRTPPWVSFFHWSGLRVSEQKRLSIVFVTRSQQSKESAEPETCGGDRRRLCDLTDLEPENLTRGSWRVKMPLIAPKEEKEHFSCSSFGADYGARTRHLHLGKVALYQMS